jgi:predicted nucleic acid-binding protein
VTVFVDTSALYAVLDRDDDNHLSAARIYPALLDKVRLATHNYVVVETAALVQRRLPADALRDLIRGLLPTLELLWVDPDAHAAAIAALLAGGSRRTSLVDWVSFEVMHRHGIDEAFAFDADFQSQGFRIRS